MTQCVATVGKILQSLFYLSLKKKTKKKTFLVSNKVTLKMIGQHLGQFCMGSHMMGDAMVTKNVPAYDSNLPRKSMA